MTPSCVCGQKIPPPAVEKAQENESKTITCKLCGTVITAKAFQFWFYTTPELESAPPPPPASPAPPPPLPEPVPPGKPLEIVMEGRVDTRWYHTAVRARNPKHYDSPDYVKMEVNHQRATAQTEAILILMGDRVWRTVPELLLLLAAWDPSRVWLQTSVSADLRNLRKKKFGGYTVDPRRRKGVVGLWEFKLTEPKYSVAVGT